MPCRRIQCPTSQKMMPTVAARLQRQQQRDEGLRVCRTCSSPAALVDRRQIKVGVAVDRGVWLRMPAGGERGTKGGASAPLQVKDKHHVVPLRLARGCACADETSLSGGQRTHVVARARHLVCPGTCYSGGFSIASQRQCYCAFILHFKFPR